MAPRASASTQKARAGGDEAETTVTSRVTWDTPVCSASLIMDRARERPSQDPSARLTAFSRANAVVQTVAALLTWALGASWLLAFGALASFAYLILAGPSPPLRRFGAANTVT